MNFARHPCQLSQLCQKDPAPEGLGEESPNRLDLLGVFPSDGRSMDLVPLVSEKCREQQSNCSTWGLETWGTRSGRALSLATDPKRSQKKDRGKKSSGRQRPAPVWYWIYRNRKASAHLRRRMDFQPIPTTTSEQLLNETDSFNGTAQPDFTEQEAGVMLITFYVVLVSLEKTAMHANRSCNCTLSALNFPASWPLGYNA